MPDEAVDSLAVAVRLLHADAPAQIMGAPQGWPRWAVLLPHVLAVTGHAGHPGRQPGPAVMDDASWLLDRAGTYLQAQAQLTDAPAPLARALAIDAAAYGPAHPVVAARLNSLALILRALGDLAGPGRCRNGRWASPRRPTARITPTSAAP